MNTELSWVDETIFSDDIPIQSTEDGRPLTSIQEEGDEDKARPPIRTPQGSKEGKEKAKFATPSLSKPNLGKRKDKEKARNGDRDRRDGEKKAEKKDKHRHDREKDNRNGTNSNRNSAAMNSDSDGGSSDAAGQQQSQQQQQQQQSQQQQSQQQQTQQLEMKVILTKSPRHYESGLSGGEDLLLLPGEEEEGHRDREGEDRLPHQTRSPLEVNGGQNHIGNII
ncbi:hypothetical protein GWK47_029593 [Chionoecetes opilio]|uniref:Uncharacterized protein n=1 Tax=Chionoecetes opilio TaxID=41210 RepID=A0A8J4YMA0_CHIOP|nr:hypothetical protein GWK47_029593 [Chionoecetes opilio]